MPPRLPNLRIHVLDFCQETAEPTVGSHPVPAQWLWWHGEQPQPHLLPAQGQGYGAVWWPGDCAFRHAAVHPSDECTLGIVSPCPVISCTIIIPTNFETELYCSMEGHFSFVALCDLRACYIVSMFNGAHLNILHSLATNKLKFVSLTTAPTMLCFYIPPYRHITTVLRYF